MRTTVLRSALAATAIAIGAVPTMSSAHHSFASEFDIKQPFEVEGAVKEMEWTNPHGWLLIDVQEGGETITYRIELSSPSQLMRQGWRRNDLQAGQKLSVTGYRAHTRHNVGRATNITTEDGKQLFRGEKLE